jgi:hypothetical protein
MWEFGTIYDQVDFDEDASFSIKRRNKIRIPWVDVFNQPLMDALDFPSVVRALLKERKLAWRVPQAGLYSRAKVWNARYWRMAVKKVLDGLDLEAIANKERTLKCSVGGCPNAVYRHPSGYISRFGLCLMHLQKRHTALRTRYQQEYRERRRVVVGQDLGI